MKICPSVILDLYRARNVCCSPKVFPASVYSVSQVRMMLRCLTVVVVAYNVCISLSATPVQWKARSIYQLLTDRFAPSTDSSNVKCSNLAQYCGGTFQGIINHFDYIQNMGFDAVWISPVVDNIPWSYGQMQAYHGYWAYNLYDTNANFGSQQELITLANTLHSNHSYLMIDVVGNHMGYPQNGNYNDMANFMPFNKTQHYHDCTQCPSSCNAQNFTCNAQTTALQSQICRLSGLPDLNQSNAFVNATLCSWVRDYVVGKWLADGIRIDTVQEVQQPFWSDFQRVAGVYAVGEVDSGDSGCDSKYQHNLNGILNYAMYYPILRVFGGAQSFSQLTQQIALNRNQFADTTLLGNFVDNHDNNRFLCTYPAKNSQYHRKYINALTFVLTFEGIPIVYYGTEQAFHGCKNTDDGSGSREVLWTSGFDANVTDIGKALPVINNARKMAEIWNYTFVALQTSNNNDVNEFYAYTRGDSFLVLLTNIGYESNVNKTYEILNPGIQSNVKFCNVFWPTADCLVYDGSGSLQVNLFEGESKIYVPASSIWQDYSEQFQNANVFGYRKEQYYK